MQKQLIHIVDYVSQSFPGNIWAHNFPRERERYCDSCSRYLLAQLPTQDGNFYGDSHDNQGRTLMVVSILGNHWSNCGIQLYDLNWKFFIFHLQEPLKEDTSKNVESVCWLIKSWLHISCKLIYIQFVTFLEDLLTLFGSRILLCSYLAHVTQSETW